MACYHIDVKVISRGAGRSSVAAAAYRSRDRLYDERQGMEFDYSRKKDLAHEEIILPEGAPSRLEDRQTLWNEVERTEKRKDAQLAREVELSLPKELNLDQQIKLVREYAQDQFVDKGMIADICIHKSETNPHAHVMLTMREVDAAGFGQKERSWNNKTHLLTWREEWAIVQNRHLMKAGYDIQVDHRSYEERGIDLEPKNTLGPAIYRYLPKGYLHLEDTRGLDKLEEYQRICRENGERIIEDPQKALMHVGHYHAVFKREEILDFAFKHSADKEQFDDVLWALERSPELIRLGENEHGEFLYTTNTMITNERAMLESAIEMNQSHTHQVEQKYIDQTVVSYTMTVEQEKAFMNILESGDVSVMIGRAGTGKSYTLGAVREAYEAEGYRVRGLALSGISAEGLTNESGIRSTTIHKQLWDWDHGRGRLGGDDILVIDEAGMVGTRQMHQVLGYAHEGGAKVILVGDNEQLQSIEAGGSFRGIIQRTGYVELANVRRQRVGWQKEATISFSGREDQAEKALDAYREHGNIKTLATKEEAKEQLMKEWAISQREHPREKSLIMAYTNKDVADLNQEARRYKKLSGELRSAEYSYETCRGMREFSTGDRIIFLRNEHSLGVRNGSLGTVERVEHGSMVVKLDKGGRVAFETALYKDYDHGYAATVHKTQGSTIDRTFVLGTKHFDKHTAYVAMSRHREDVTMYYGKDEFRTFTDLKQSMSKQQPKDLAVEYAIPRGIMVDERAVLTQSIAQEINTNTLGKQLGDQEIDRGHTYGDRYSRFDEKLHQKALDRYSQDMMGKGIKVEFVKDRPVEGYYEGMKEIDGRKYGVIQSIEGHDKGTEYMIPYDKQYDHMHMRRVAFDGKTLDYAMQKNIERSLDEGLTRGKGRGLER